MKKLLTGFLLLSTFTAFAGENYNSVICTTASGSRQGYFNDGVIPIPIVELGCNPSAQCAGDNLKWKLQAMGEIGDALYSPFFEKHIEVVKKNVSKVTISTTISRMIGKKCNGDSYPYGDLQVDCSESIACVAIEVEYQACKKVSYDPTNGAKIVTCPSGRIIL